MIHQCLTEEQRHAVTAGAEAALDAHCQGFQRLPWHVGRTMDIALQVRGDGAWYASHLWQSCVFLYEAMHERAVLQASLPTEAPSPVRRRSRM